MKRLSVISLGGGVQSSVVALMATDGAFGNTPECVIFADTPLEPPSISTHLDWLAEQLRFPLLRRGQWPKPPRGREGPRQPLRQPQLR